MDLGKYLNKGADAPAEETPKLSKEEYAAQKKQERDEIWAEIDSKAQDIFKDGQSLRGFLDFMAQCRPQKTVNLLLLYSQNPEIRQVKTYEKWREENHLPKPDAVKYKFLVDQEYEKNGTVMQGYTVRNAYDISDMRMKQPEPAMPRSMEELMGALLTDSPVRIQIADNLPEKVQAQYNSRSHIIYVMNGMSEEVTFHAINRELACAAIGQRGANFNRASVSAQAYCAAYVAAQHFGVETLGFQFERVCAMQGNGDKDPKELRSFVADIRKGAYHISQHMERNLSGQEQEFSADEFAISEGKQGKDTKSKTQPER